MKISVVLIFFTIGLASAYNASGQNAFISLNVKNQPISEVLDKIEKQSNYFFFYNNKEIDVNRTVSMDVENKQLRDVLNIMFDDSKIRYSVLDESIVLSNREILMPVSVTGKAQGITITGTVTDEAGESIPGVNVVVKGSVTGVISDFSGKYTITVPDRDAVLVFSFVGYTTIEQAVGDQTKVDVLLKESVQDIEEVVVIGYGVARKSDVTGAVTRADLSVTQHAPNVDIAQSIKGIIPGLNIGYGSSNRAGNSDDISISIRGRNSISGTTTPLIVVDGIIFRGGINDINPSDIESIDVLKDASSAAIYGSQAANGVLLITTKTVKGASKPVIEYNGNIAFQSLTNPDMWSLSRDDYEWQIESHQLEQSRLGPDFLLPNPAWDIESRFRLDSQRTGWNAGTDTDWMGLNTVKVPYIQRHSLGVRGKTDLVSYYLSFGLMDQKNLIINDTFKRYNFRVNLEAKITNWLTFGTQTFFTMGDMSGQTPGMGEIAGSIPISSPYDDNGDIIVRLDRGSINPLATQRNEDLDKRYIMNGNFYGDVKIPFIEGLNYRVQYSQNLRFSNQYRFDYTANVQRGQGYKNYTNRNAWTVDNIVGYRRVFGKHSVNATFVYGVEKQSGEGTNSAANYFTSTVLGYNNLGVGQKDQNALTSSAWEETSLYTMARVVYTFNDRYVATATIRHDGYSGFGENNKTANFPSLAFAWRISEEDFFKSSVPWCNSLKLRTSFGKAGNRTASRYSTLATMGMYNPYFVNADAANAIGQYLFGDGATPELIQGVKTLPNPDLRWETTTSFDFGVDFSVLSGRLFGTYDFYYSKTTDLLYNVAIPSLNGAFPVRTNNLNIEVASNIGKMQNMGHEISITGIPVMRNGFEWLITGNFARNRNKVLSIYGDGKDLVNAKIFMNHPYGVCYDYNRIGMWQLDDYYAGRIPEGAYFGTYKVEDINGDGELHPETDRKILGYESPSYTFSIRNLFTWKGFELSFLINSIQGGKDYYLGQPIPSPHTLTSDLDGDYYPIMRHDWWMPENPNARYKRLSVRDPRIAEFAPYVSRSFIRLQDVSLAYNLPSSLLKKLHISRAKIFVNGTNLMTISDWDGWDPEANQGLTMVTYPVMKSYSFGVNFEF